VFTSIFYSCAIVREKGGKNGLAFARPKSSLPIEGLLRIEHGGNSEGGKEKILGSRRDAYVFCLKVRVLSVLIRISN